MRFKEIVNSGYKDREWIIKDLIPLGEIVILYAPTDYNKTFLAVKIALEILTASQELGVTKYGNVCIFSPDTRMEDLVLRIRGLIKANYEERRECISENLQLEFDEIDLTSDGYQYWYCDAIESEKIGTWEEWGKYDFSDTSGRKPTLLIIDSLSQSIGENTINDDRAIRIAIRNLKRMINHSAAGLSILVIAHAGKNPSKGLMGSSIQKNDVPTVLKIRKTKGNQFELYREKIKSKASGKSIPFKMREISIDGQETLYVDIGTNLNSFENAVLKHYELGHTKDEIRDIVCELKLDNTTTRNSFNVVFNRCWKKLINSGFIKENV